MTNRTRTGIVLLVLAQGLAGCDGSGSSSVPTAPSPAIRLVVFTDSAAGFSMTDVRDVEEQIVSFNTANELVWTPTGARFPGYPVTRNVSGSRYFIGWNQYYEVSFATRDGEPLAYLCAGEGVHADVSPSICKIEVVGGQLVITATGVPCPGGRE